jgi:hypothetical protein
VTLPPETMSDAPNLTYCGQGYEPGPYGAIITAFDAGNGLVIGVANARWEADANDAGDVTHSIEYDRRGKLAVTLGPDGNLPWPPPWDLVLLPLTDEEDDEYGDALWDALREVMD